MADDSKPATLAPPAVTSLRQEAAANAMQRIQMERSVSQDMRDQREDLKEAAEHSLNVIMDLGMDGNIRYVSKSWKDVVGTDPEDVVGKPVADLLLGNPDQFAETVESIKKDDSRSHIIRFSMRMGPQSVFRRKLWKRTEAEEEQDQNQELPVEEEEEDQILNLEAQGIMVYDRTTGVESHTMWMIRPSVIREVTIDLPRILVEALGVGAEMLAHYLTELAEHAGSDPANHPPPPPPSNVLCRICERNITPWWFEKHTELCLQEHRAEMDVQMAQETLSEHRNAIVKVLDALEAQNRPTRATSADGGLQPPQLPEYKGAIIQPTSTPSSGTPSGRNSPASPPSRSRERSTGFGHHRARSFAVRRPLARIVELVLDLCDTALEVNTPAIKDNSRTQSIAEIRTQSPQSENRISQVLQWQSPAASSTDHCDGLKLLCDDTNKLARAKVDAVFRHRRILEYSERIRIEFDILVHECIDAAMEKAARIAAGEDSSTDDEQQECDPQEDPQHDANDIPTGEEGIFPGSFEGPSAMAQALRNASDPSLPARLSRRESSVAGSTRSNSPRGGCQTPRSHVGASAINIAPTQNKRHSMHFESDAGADSDSSMRSSSVMSGPRRADSPSSELGLSRVTTSRERKRKSLILPSVMTSRQHSPARSMVPPSSPLRTNKPRLPSSADALQSPITSPILTTTEFSSPAMAHVQHHRRQSSTAGSDGPKPVSPRLPPVTQPQPRALPPSIKDFEVIKPISKGAFGSVYLAKKKTTGEYYAIKVLRKADMVAKNQVTNVKAERAIMMWQGESDFVAKLYWTFSSKDYLYLVMEYLNGGDCASLIKVLGGLPEDWAKKYLAEVVLGVEHLHSRGIVHRDLKPDNLLIDQNGHLKLTDFGLSRMGLIGRQKRALKSNEPAPDLLKTGPFHRATSVGSSRSASFDLNPSPSQTPSMTPALAGDLGQPSYFSLSRESSAVRDPSRRVSGNRSDSGDSEALQTMFRRFSLMDDQFNAPRSRSPIEEEAYSDEGSPDLFPLAPIMSQSSVAQNNTPPASSAMPPPPMALFDPEDNNRRFVGTPDYLAPETIAGSGQDEVSDWWSLGCILFECLYGYPPFHADTPDEVFQNILARKIDWPENDEDYGVSDEAKDLMNKLMCSDPKQRLGANMEDKFASGGEEIRNHIWFEDINWDTLREDEASFIPAPENPEDTEYFDTRGAAMQNFAPEFEDQGTSSAGTPSADYPDRPHDALSRVRSQVSVTTMKRGLIPLHIPAHIREGRTRRLSEPMATDSFGNFSYKNLPVLDKANKDIIQKMRAEGMHSSSKATSAVVSPSMTSPSPSLESSPHIAAPLLKRTLSTNKSGHRPSSPSISGPASSPSRGSQPSSPLLVQFSTGQHERRKTSAGNSSTLSHATSNPSSLQPGNFFEVPRSSGLRPSPEAVSPIKLAKTPTGIPGSNPDKGTGQRQSSLGQTSAPSPRSRSHTMGSQEDDVVRDLLPNHYKRRSQVLDVSPSSSDTEDSRQKALLRVQRRRQSSRRLSQISLADGPIFRPLDVLVCEDHPVSRLVMEKLLEKLRCRTLTVTNGSEAVRYAMGEVKFDIIMMEYKLPQVNGADVARMIRDTKNANSMTPIVAVTGYLKDLQAPHHFDALIEKPPTIAKLSDTLGKLCQWKPPPPNWTPSQSYPSMMPSGLRQESTRQEDSPTSNSSGFPPVPSGSYRGSSREDSISSSFFGDNESRTGDDVPVIIARHNVDEWRDRDIARAMGGLGISEDVGNVDPKDAGHVLQKPPGLPTHDSAPAILEETTLRRQRSAEMVDAKRRLLETRKHESAESGDDEDDELGNTNVRTKSPKTRPRSSKLGIEMLRTNSRGSVISVEDVAAPDSTLPSSPPPAITEDRNAEEREATADIPPVSLTPPEIFPRKPGGEIQEIQVETPKANSSQSSEPDPDPTPRPNTSLDV